MDGELIHRTNEVFQEELNSTRIELVKFLYLNNVDHQPIFYTTERVCLDYLANFHDITTLSIKNPTVHFPTLDIFKQGFENMILKDYDQNVATVLLSDPNIAVVEGLPENASKSTRYNAEKVMFDYEKLIKSGQSDLDAAYNVKKFSSIIKNKTDDIPQIIANAEKPSLGKLEDFIRT